MAKKLEHQSVYEKYDLDGDIEDVQFTGTGSYDGSYTIAGDVTINGSYDMFAVALVGAGPVFALSMLSHAGIGAIARAVPNAMIMGEALGGAALLGMIATGVSAMSWPVMSESSLLLIVEAFGV